jgi:4'-phosphopantetheinyl transferase
MSVVYFTRLTQFSSDHLLSKIHCLPQQEVDRILVLKFEMDRQRSIAGKLLLLHALKQSDYWDKNYLPEISYTSFGRPYLKEHPVDFNISHSGNIVACSVIRNGRIGIDIEKVDPVDFADYGFVLDTNEIDRIVNSASPLLDFYQTWTFKEAVMKADGRGFSLDPLSINIANGQSFIHPQKWYLFSLAIHPGYIASVATTIPVLPIFEQVPVHSLAS